MLGISYVPWFFFTKYALVKPLIDKKDKTVLNAFIKILNDSNRNPNKLWVDRGTEFYKKKFERMVRQ